MPNGVALSRSRGLENRELRTTNSVETLHTERLALGALTQLPSREGRRSAA